MDNRDLICENLSVSDDGVLCFAGQRTDSLAREYGTPLYLMDEDRIRHNIRTYVTGMEKALGKYGHILYASKAASFKRIYEIAADEGIGIDVVSCGEIATAVKAGFPLENAYFHSNNKTDDDIRYAMDKGIGYFVVDNQDELYALNDIAGEKGICQKLLLRITPASTPTPMRRSTRVRWIPSSALPLRPDRQSPLPSLPFPCRALTCKAFIAM